MRNEGILLGTEHAADQPFPVLRYPITPPVLGDLEMVRSQYRQRREAGHTISAKLINPMLSPSASVNLLLPLGFETGLDLSVLILHTDRQRNGMHP